MLVSLFQQSKISPDTTISASVSFAGLLPYVDTTTCRVLACNLSKVVGNPWIIDSGATNHMTPQSPF